MKGYVDFNSNHKRLPQHREFTDLIKPSISFPVSHRQMSEKIRRVKNKYTNAIKGGGGGGGGGIFHIDLGGFDEGKRPYFTKKLKALMVKELELYSEKAELVTSIVEELKSMHEG
ncbi:hypothetical protein LguiB_020497 [Lonicera macranthoides]